MNATHSCKMKYGNSSQSGSESEWLVAPCICFYNWPISLLNLSPCWRLCRTPPLPHSPISLCVFASFIVCISDTTIVWHSIVCQLFYLFFTQTCNTSTCIWMVCFVGKSIAKFMDAAQYQRKKNELRNFHSRKTTCFESKISQENIGC